MKIAFVQTAHQPLDERVFYHQAPALSARQDEFLIISTRTDTIPNSNCICFNDSTLSKKILISKIAEHLSQFIPDIVICDTPWAVLGAQRYKRDHSSCKIVYDVTEWYPSKKNLNNHSFFNRIFRLFALSLLNIYTGAIANGYIFGEIFKSKLFRLLFPHKSYCFLSYYPDNKFIPEIPVRDISHKCRLLFSGNLTVDKGYDNLMATVIEAAQRHLHIEFELTILCPTPPTVSEVQLSNLKILYKPYLPFPEFCKTIGEYDIFLDLRKNDFENTHCLPIKIFYIMAAGRPSIVTNLKAIKYGIPEYDKFSFLVNPNDIHSNVEIILKYIDNPDFYQSHCQCAIQYSRQHYQWSCIEGNFINFLTKL